MVLKEKIRLIKLAEKADIKDKIQDTSRFLLPKLRLYMPVYTSWILLDVNPLVLLYD